VAPTGWRVGRGTRTTGVGDVRARLAACGRLDPRYARAFEVGNGYQRAVGDWDTNEAFPDGHRALTTEVHAQGLLAGLWLAPFAASERSGIPAAHASWLLKGADGAPIVCDTKDPEGALYILDGAHPEVAGWLTDLARRAREDWGYDYLALDWLGMATAGTQYAGGATRAEAYRSGLAALRRGAGPDLPLLAATAPLQHAVGLVDAMAVGAPGDPTSAGLEGAARASAQRSFYHRGAWLNDPDLLTLAASGDQDAALRASLTAVLGGVTFCADDPATLPADRVALLARTMPSVPGLGRPIGIPGSDHGLSSAWVAQGAPGWWTVVLINWGDQAADIEATFDALGLPRTTYTAYDVWRNAPLADVTDRISSTLESRTSLTLGLRAALRTPQVVGSTRHVVQGVDISAETWHTGSRTLQATAAALDHRPYTVVIAVPHGLEPVTATADPACTLTTLATGHAVLAWEAGDGGDLPWSLAFRTRPG
jgi:hypothetical protein